MTHATKEPMMEDHCKDCCCARSWKALGIEEYTGKSIPEHITEREAVTAQLVAALIACKALLPHDGKLNNMAHEKMDQALAAHEKMEK